MHIPHIAPKHAVPFELSQPGIVYDATTHGVRLALTSHDDGACSFFADRADRNALYGYLSEMLAKFHLRALVVKDHDDARLPSVHHRNYHIAIRGHIFMAMVSSDNKPNAIAAILSLDRLSPTDAIPQDSRLIAPVAR